MSNSRNLTHDHITETVLANVQGETDWPDDLYDPRNGSLEWYAVTDDSPSREYDLHIRGQRGAVARVRVTVEVVPL